MNNNLVTQKPQTTNGMDIQVVNLAKAIRQQESGGNFDAVGDNGTSKGAYQWQPKTWQEHAKTVLGDSNAPMTRENQNAVAYGIMKQWKDQGLNVADIAAKWNSGQSNGWENKVGTTTINGKNIKYDVPSYVKGVTDKYQAFKAETEGSESQDIMSQYSPDQQRRAVDSLVSEYTKSKEGKAQQLITNYQNQRPLLKDYGKNTAEAFNRGADTVAQGYNNLGEGIKEGSWSKIGRGLLAVPAGVIDSVFSPITGAVTSASQDPTIKAGTEAIDKYVVQPVANKISDIPAVQKFAVENPNAGEVFQNALTVGSTILPIKSKTVREPIVNGVKDAIVVSRETPKVLARKVQEMVTNSETKIQSKIIDEYKRSVKPGIQGKTTPAQIAQYDESILSGVKSIENNKANLKFNSADGDVITGELPKNLQELVDSIDQTKQDIFKKYDDMAQVTGDGGLKIDIAPAIKELDEVIKSKSLALTNPEAVQYARDLQYRFSQAGEINPVTLQEVVKNFNESLKAYYRNPTAESTSKMSINALLVNNFREALDSAISSKAGPGYAQLKKQYGALKALEKDVVKASLRDARKNMKGLIDYSDILSGGQLVTGLVSGNPAFVASAATQKAIQAYIKYLNSPNRAIKNMFKQQQKLTLRDSVPLKNKGKTVPKVSGKYEVAGKALSKEAEKWLDENFKKYKSRKYRGEELEQLRKDNPKVYKEVMEFLNLKFYEAKLALPAKGESSFKGDVMYGTSKGKVSADLQEAVDVNAVDEGVTKHTKKKGRPKKSIESPEPYIPEKDLPVIK